ncbi:MAG: 4-alpha-glucanotransferase [Prevotellaceae bacterium]|jgi:4-alpha-glucanotransferase|nr:4-alpha-glucanotransferase [Prevotellaceae bacterium]
MLDLTFKTVCKTHFGQNLFVKIENKEFSLTYTKDFLWVCCLNLDFDNQINYSYYIKNEKDKITLEDKTDRKIILPKNCKNAEIYDEFLFSDRNIPFKTKPFNVYFPNQNRGNQSVKKATVNFSVEYPALSQEFELGLTGSFCDWEEKKLLRLKKIDYCLWTVSVPIEVFAGKSDFKFVVLNKNKTIQWEDGKNRVLDINPAVDYLQYTAQFSGQNIWKASGVAIPVFSLRSDNDWGVGEFEHLKLLADWACLVGLKIIQILPVNDTTETRANTDAYPYRINSVYALHPIYINLKKVGIINDKTLRNEFEKKRTDLNSNNTVDYQKVFETKLEYLRIIYNQSEKSFETDDFKDFIKRNRNWLLYYAAYSCLRDKNHTADFTQWGEYSVFDVQKVKCFAREHKRQIEFYCFVQYHLEFQLTEVKKYLNSNGIALKGDLPIGVSANSMEVWQLPHLFHRDMSAGAPPDDFSQIGQNWGFPTYNWQNMAKDDYHWWQQRFKAMEKFFDAIRIDHILGFFRIWEIPLNALWGLLGTFNPALPLSVEDIEKYGIKFDSKRFIKPFINEYIINKLFGENSEKIKKMFFRKERGVYSFKKEFDSQRKIVAKFSESHFDRTVLKALLQLHCEVIFIEDVRKKIHYHPRISLLNSLSFQNLELSEREKLILLYENFFYVRQNEFWKQNAVEQLSNILSGCSMLICGEDLGMLPQSVPDVMRQLHILSLEIQRMPKECGVEFVDLSQTPYFSVCSTGTHDMSPLRAWWMEDKEKTQRFYNKQLEIIGLAPENCTPEIAKTIIAEHFKSNSMLAIIPLQDCFAIDQNVANPDFENERINTPDNPNNLWCYRIHLTLEEFLSKSAFSINFVRP